MCKSVVFTGKMLKFNKICNAFQRANATPGAINVGHAGLVVRIDGSVLVNVQNLQGSAEILVRKVVLAQVQLVAGKAGGGSVEKAVTAAIAYSFRSRNRQDEQNREDKKRE